MNDCVYATASFGVHDRRWVQALRNLGHDPAVVVLDLPIENRKVDEPSPPKTDQPSPPKLPTDIRSSIGYQSATSIAEFRELVAIASTNGQPVLAGPLPNLARHLVGLPTRVVGLSWGFDLHELAAADDTKWLCGLDGLVVDSGPTRDIALAAGMTSDAITFLPWGIDLDAFSPFGETATIGDKYDSIVLSLRAHEQLYRVEDIVSAFVLVLQEVPNARLIVGHGGSRTDALREQAHRLGISERVTFIDTVDESALAPLLRAADCYVSASSVDGTSVTLLQAMACETPVVVSATPGNLGWVVEGETGYVFPTGDVDAMAAAIVRALRGSSTALTERARSAVIARADWSANIVRLNAALFPADPPLFSMALPDLGEDAVALVRALHVAAVVPAYRPDAAEITELVRSLVAGGMPVLVDDDGSTDADYLADLTEIGAQTMRHDTNAGIARSLNDGLRFARERGAHWLLTVDQDTVLPPNYVLSVLATVTDRVGAIGAQTIGDVGGDLRYPARIDGDLLVTEELFQTGTLWRVAALEQAGGFDEDFGIDAVDAAACLRLRELGWAIALAPGVRLEHRYGSGRQVRLLGRTVVATGHSAQRRETMVRNRLRLFRREFRQSPAHALRTLRRLGVNVVLGVTIEDDRWAKAKAAARGLLPPR